MKEERNQNDSVDKAFNEGWNANIDDLSIFSNPYNNLELRNAWMQGWKACQREWYTLAFYKKQPERKF